MIRFKMSFDGTPVFESQMPFPAIGITLKLLVQLMLRRARQHQNHPFNGRIADFDVMMHTEPKHEGLVGPLTAVPDDAVVQLHALSKWRSRDGTAESTLFDTWELEV